MKPDRKKKQHSSRESRQPERKTKRGSGGDQRMAQDVEPSAGSEITPVWLFVLMGLMLYGGMLYLNSYAGGFNPKVYEAFTSYKLVENANPKSGPEMLIAKGESLYMVCAACHQVNGMGVALQFPPLAGSEWVNEPNPARLIRIPLHGMNGPIKVKDQDWNASMAALGAALSSEDIAAILSYIRQAWGNNAPPVSPADVDAVKEDTKSRPMDGSRPWLIDDLMKVPVAP
ncbi:MAG: cytochrome c [Verrucomicrobia bacterium]|nr:cytochrome c [Verrucomicrobiota bacterium]